MKTITRIKHSPFLLALIGGCIVTVADMLWLGGELSLHFGIITEHFYVIYRMALIMPAIALGLVIAIYAGVVYIKDSYIRLDDNHRLNKCREKLAQVKRDKVFKR